MNTKLNISIITLAGVLALSGCVTNQSRSAAQYDSMSSGQMQYLQYGRVIDLRAVNLKLNGSQAASAAMAVGGIIGATAGSKIAKPGSNWNIVGGTVGAAAGALGAEMLADAGSSKAGVEISIALETGQKIAVVQETDIQFQVGQCVKVSQSGQARVSPANGCSK